MFDDKTAETVGFGAGATTVGGIGYAAAGMSAAQITGTLATIGSTVGGGMAAGVCIVGAAPLAIGAIAYGIYSFFDD